MFATNAILQGGGKQRRGSCAKLEFFAAPFRREYFGEACCGTKAPSQLGNEVFCVVFQTIVEVKSEVSRVILHTGTVPLSELIAVFKSHMLIQTQTPNSSELYILECR